MVSTDHPERMSVDEFVRRLKEILASSASENTQLIARFTEFLRESSQAISSGRTGDAEALLSRWLDFNLASYTVLSRQTVALLNGLLSAAENTLIPRAAPTPGVSDKGAPRVELKLSGRPGERATTGFMIENHFDRPLAVTFESSELIPMAGPALPASLLSFVPTTAVIEQGGQKVVQAAITITPEFVVGETYTTTIRLLGFEAKRMGLSVTILPPADPSTVPSPTQELPTPAKKQRPRGKR
jgi:hypothetical protein